MSVAHFIVFAYGLWFVLQPFLPPRFPGGRGLVRMPHMDFNVSFVYCGAEFAALLLHIEMFVSVNYQLKSDRVRFLTCGKSTWPA